MPEDVDQTIEDDPPLLAVAPPQDEVDGYAAGAVACAVASFLVPIVLAVAALILARASELHREQTDDAVLDHSRNDTLVWLARVAAWTNIVLACAFLIFLLLGIAARVAA